MHQPVEFKADRSATVPGQWVGVVTDEKGHTLVRTTLTFDTSDEARFGARIVWQGRQARLQMAKAQAVRA